MEIVPLQEEHKESLVRLLVSYWKTRGMSYSSGWTSRYVEEGHMTEIMEDRFFVALESGEVVGSMSVILWVGNRAEMRDFFVKPEFRAKGVGEQIYQRVESFCKDKGVGKLFAFVLPAVVDFFTKHGFEVEGRLKGACKNSEDLVAIGKFL